MGFRLTNRDVEIIREVEQFRLLGSRSHILPLFGGSMHLLRRLRKLHEHKYLCRLPGREPNEEAVYAIGNAGADLLSAEFNLPRPTVDYTQQNKRLGPWFVEHTLLVADIMTVLRVACRQQTGVRYVSPEEILETWAPASTRKQRYQIGGRPLRWQVTFSYDSQTYRKSIEPDYLFALEYPDGRLEPFFLEADRQNMPVKSRNMDRSSIFKKQLQYWESWKTYAADETNLFEQRFGLPNIRTLFAIETGYRGEKRLNRCLSVSKYFRDGAGTGLFLFAKAEILLEALRERRDTTSTDILTAPLISGRQHEKTLLE